MKRSIDLIRDLMLEIEETPVGEEYHAEDSMIEVQTDTLIEHLRLLEEAGFIVLLNGQRYRRDGTTCIRITWKGWEFLDAVRDKPTWKKARQKVNDADASVSVKVLVKLIEKISRFQIGI